MSQKYIHLPILILMFICTFSIFYIREKVNYANLGNSKSDLTIKKIDFDDLQHRPQGEYTFDDKRLIEFDKMRMNWLENK